MTRAALWMGSFVVASLLLLEASSCGTTCGPTNCAGCCSAKNECVLAPSAVSCGASGSQCMTCSPGQSCVSGLCALNSASGGGGATGGGSGGGVSGGGAGGGSGGGTTGGGAGGGSVGPQPGCTLDNCHAMINACRVELIGGAAVTCAYYYPPPPSWDSATGCVVACNELGLGEVAACVAGKADLCLAARDAGTSVDAELNSCVFGDGGVPNPTCEQACATAQRDCNDVCYPRTCDQCYRAGGTSCPTCPDAGFVACIECSQACGRQYARCLNGC